MAYGKFNWLPRCQYGVYYELGYESDCNKPAAIRIEWGPTMTLYTCEEHAMLIQEQEEADRDEEHAKYDAECAEALAAARAEGAWEARERSAVLADEKCRCFYDRAVKAEKDLAAAKSEGAREVLVMAERLVKAVTLHAIPAGLPSDERPTHRDLLELVDYFRSRCSGVAR